MSVNGGAIELQGLTRRFGAVIALDGVSLNIRQGEFFSLLGPSGCGKTTLLRLIAGLDHPDSGSLRIGGISARDLPAHQRPVNTVFQSYALFPHLSVCDNIAFGLRMKKVPPAQIAARTDQAMALVQVTGLAARKPAQLSGGEKQRVALARALVNEPQVLLLDEPLGALDLKLRKQLQVELHQLQRRLGITFIYVTHDQDEALVMSDRIAVMNAGRIEQLGVAAELYESPRTRFVAQFLGSCNLISARVERLLPGGFVADSNLGMLEVDTTSRVPRTITPGLGHAVTLAIRPEKILLASPDEPTGCNRLAVQVEDLVYCGAETQYRLRAGNAMLHAVALNSRVGAPGFRIGEMIRCHLPAVALLALDD